jgi:hypothetical protein
MPEAGSSLQLVPSCLGRALAGRDVHRRATVRPAAFKEVQQARRLGESGTYKDIFRQNKLPIVVGFRNVLERMRG